MTLLQLKYVATVANCGSFSKAAQKLFVSQPGISKMVRALELELGITIFDRTSTGIKLTAKGRELFNMGNRLLNDVDLMTQHFKQERQGAREILNVSSQHYCFAVDALTMLRDQEDSFIYKLLLGQNPEVIEQVASNESELGVILAGEHNQKFLDRQFGESNLEFHELIRSTPFVFFHKSHPLAKKDSVTLEDLQPYPCIMYDLEASSPSILHESFLVTDFYPQDFYPQDFYPRKVYIVNGLYQSVQVMIQCEGYDFGSGMIVPSNRALGVVRRPVRGYDIQISIGWICQRSHILSPLAADYTKCLEAICKENQYDE